MQVISGIIFTLLFLGLLAVGVVYSGAYDITATSGHTKPVEWMLHKAKHQAIARNTYSLRDRDFSDKPAAVARGAAAYDQMCSGCHGAPGKAPFAAAENMLPAPTSLNRMARNHSAKEIFYVTKFGLKMTGMPAWGSVADDPELWDIAGFITQSDGLGEAGYESMLATATGGTATSAEAQTEVGEAELETDN